MIRQPSKLVGALGKVPTGNLPGRVSSSAYGNQQVPPAQQQKAQQRVDPMPYAPMQPQQMPQSQQVQQPFGQGFNQNMTLPAMYSNFAPNGQGYGFNSFVMPQQPQQPQQPQGIVAPTLGTPNDRNTY